MPDLTSRADARANRTTDSHPKKCFDSITLTMHAEVYVAAAKYAIPGLRKLGHANFQPLAK